MRSIEVETELSIEELEQLYLNAKTGLEQRRAHVILLRKEGMRPGEVARIVRFTARMIAVIVRKFNESGPDTLIDKRTQNPGRVPLLDEEGKAKLLERLQTLPADGGRWTGPKVARWLEGYLEREVNSLADARGWDSLKAVEYSYKSNRPRHANSATEEERGLWKKN